ncbi:MAG: hypothetical protein KGJ09_02960 [Candidatus Omnitrophica bacterium]|nr:hypothetical protein [Candidatus Omnitrophota bacterium]MDE2009021.1 hypothetical protein [Candidatus Omnitrophota bacterium]MDE2214545.1 hypothetical protein [Candidatus Omnitrophota bacterium]MDE2230863.1 hypothetical protein [Candidatus Omnitrophota bacterium]
MKKISRIFVAFLLAVSLVVSTVICCCIAPAVAAHFQKEAACSHCMGHKASGRPSDPLCPQQLMSADFLHAPALTFSESTGGFSFTPVLFVGHHPVLTRLILSVHPPGGPPLGMDFIPLYLRTFQLRI